MKKILLIILLVAVVDRTGYAEDFWSDEDAVTEAPEVVEEQLPEGRAYMVAEKIDDDLMRVEVYVEQLGTPVVGAAFSLLYEGEKLSFLKYEPGDFLERGGDPFYMVSNNEEDSKVHFGVTLRREDKFPAGDGLLAVLDFQLAQGEDFLFQFDQGVFSTVDTVRQDLQNIQWNDLYFDGSADVVSSKFDNQRPVVLSSQNEDGLDAQVMRFSKILAVILVSVLIIVLAFFLKKRRRESVNFNS